MSKKIVRDWVQRLRDTPNDMQGRNGLKDIQGKMCCLGVLTEMAVEAGVVSSYPLPDNACGDDYFLAYGEKVETHYLPVEVQEWSGVNYNPRTVDGEYLSKLNDSGRYTFDAIADEIEKGLVRE